MPAQTITAPQIEHNLPKQDKFSRTTNPLMKKDTITRMLEEVDQSMAFRAERLIAKVMPTLDIKKPVAQRRESVFIALTDGFALEEKKVEEPVLSEA